MLVSNEPMVNNLILIKPTILFTKGQIVNCSQKVKLRLETFMDMSQSIETNVMIRYKLNKLFFTLIAFIRRNNP